MYSLTIKKSVFSELLSVVFIFCVITTGVYANPNKAKTLFISAQVAYENKQYDDAIQALKAVKKVLGKSNARISALELKIYLAQSDFGLAKQALDEFYNHKATDSLLKETSPYIIKVENYFLEADEQFEAIKGLSALKTFLKKYPFRHYRQKASGKYYLTPVQKIITTKIISGNPGYFKEGTEKVEFKFGNKGNVIHLCGQGYCYEYEYKYDNVGNLTEQTSYDLDPNKEKRLLRKNDYSYDKKGRLLEEIYEWNGPVPSKTQKNYDYVDDKIIKRTEKALDFKYTKEYSYEYFDNGNHKESHYEKHWEKGKPSFLSSYSIFSRDNKFVQFTHINKEKLFDGKMQYKTNYIENTFNQFGDINSKKETHYMEGNKNNPEWVVMKIFEYKYEKMKFNFL